jgi:long-subunit acyl-CoA synthetase (AMP-forming)
MGSSSSKNLEYGVWVGPEATGETRVLRHPQVANGELISEPFSGMNTIWKAFEFSVKQHPERNFLGTRKVLSKDKFGEYEFKTYQQIDSDVRNFGAGLVTLGLTPEIQSERDGMFRFLGIYGKNREEWIVSDLAAHMLLLSMTLLVMILLDMF